MVVLPGAAACRRYTRFDGDDRVSFPVDQQNRSRRDRRHCLFGGCFVEVSAVTPFRDESQAGHERSGPSNRKTCSPLHLAQHDVSHVGEGTVATTATISGSSAAASSAVPAP